MRLLMLLLSTAALAADNYPILVYPAPHGTPRVDGALTDEAWREAPVVGGFIWYNRAELVERQTSFQVVWDERALYLGIRCEEPDIARLKPMPAPLDSHQVFGSEAIELFVDPRHDHVDYYQVAINAAGSVYDGRQMDLAWSSNAEAGTAVGADAWVLEVALPWAPMGPRPPAGGVVGLNVCRDRTLTQDREWSCWSQVNANFHDPLRFGHVLLSADPGDAGKQAEALRKGERQGPLRVFGRAGYGQESYAALARSTLQRAEQRAADFRRLRETAEAGEAEALGRRLKPLEERLEAIRKTLAGEVDGAAYAKAELALSGLISELETAYWDARLEALLKSL